MPYDHGWGWGWGMGIGMLVFWGLVVVAAVLLVRAFATRRRVDGDGPAAHTETPREILEKRYARGEIDKAEFEERKHALEG